MVLPGTTPAVCPVASIVNTNPKREPVEEMTLDSLGPCVQRYILTHEKLAQFRLSVRSDVMRTREIADVSFSGNHYQVMIVVHGCGFKSPLSKKKNSYGGSRTNVVIHQTSVWVTPLSVSAFRLLKQFYLKPRGAKNAFRQSQSLLENLETPQFVGAGESTDNQDFLADSTTLEVVDPDSKDEDPQVEEQSLEVYVPMLESLTSQWAPYAHCAWCDLKFYVPKGIEDHYLAEHCVVLQVSCCPPLSVFQTIMRMELQLRQSNFGPHSAHYAELKHGTIFEKAKRILGAYCGKKTQHDSLRKWFVKIPDFRKV